MKSVAAMTAVAALGAAVSGCASESYYGRGYGYGYQPYAYSSPAYYRTSAPAYYRTSSYGYSYPQYSNRRAYDGYWDYQRNYRGIHAAPEFSSM
jgi:hypothetical protein